MTYKIVHESMVFTKCRTDVEKDREAMKRGCKMTKMWFKTGLLCWAERNDVKQGLCKMYIVTFIEVFRQTEQK